MTLRTGVRWAWAEHGAVSQRETENVNNYGSDNRSIEDELRAVVARWLREEPAAASPHPATMAEARRVTELCEELYGDLGRPPLRDEGRGPAAG